MGLRSRRTKVLMGMIFLVASLSFSVLKAQDNTVTLSVSLSEFMRNIVTDQTFAAFENSHPGVKVYINYAASDSMFAPSPAAGIDDHLKTVEALARSADVVMVGSQSISDEATRAGYFLDLTPLSGTDSSLNSDDFFPATWQSFQWDGGIWALPVSADVITMTYDKAAFDKAGLAYPNEHWTMQDIVNAATALTQRDANGNVTLPGLVTFGSTGYLLRSLLGHGFYDSSVTPQTPKFTDPDLESLLTQFAQLEKDGDAAKSFNGDISAAPLRIFGGFGLRVLPGTNTQSPGSSLLPGGMAGLDVQGVAVSSGTQYPELAYELAKYMTKTPDFVNNPLSIVSARRSLVGAQPNLNVGGEGSTTASASGGGSSAGGPAFIAVAPQLTPDEQTVVTNALDNAIPVSEMRFADYVTDALEKINSDNLDAHTALQDAETQATTDLQTAADKQTSVKIVVTPPPPEFVLPAGKIVLKFGVQSFVSPTPNQDQWNQLAQDFAANDPQVGQVNLDIGAGDANSYSSSEDCFYLPYNTVPSLDSGKVLNLDPYMDADPTFDKSDLVGNTLAQVQRDNQTWAMPIVVLPQLLDYESDLFQKAGVTVPPNGWTVDSFVDALHALKTAYPDKKPFEARDPGGSYLLTLIAEFGGIPLDFRTDPPTVNFTDPNTVNAIRQVLDLAKNGYIDYQELAKNSFTISVSADSEDLIRTRSLDGIFFLKGGSQSDPYKITMYPTGNQFSAISYDVGTAYISAGTQYADACYRWISTVAKHPELFSAMPARRSILQDSSYVASQGADTVAVYQQLDTLMQNPNTVVFPTPFTGGGGSTGNFILQYWLNRAFDHYVLQDADLETELQNAQTFAKDYLACTANVPTPDPSTPVPGAMKAYSDCALQVDPSTSSLFAPVQGVIGG